MVGPGVFEAVREQFDGRGALAVPDQKAGCGGAESTHHPKNIFHWRCSFFAFGLRHYDGALRCIWRVGCGEVPMCCWFVNGGFRGCGGNGYTLRYGFGSLWTGAGNWSAFSGEDDDVGGGCGYFSEPFGGGKGRAERGGGFGFNCFFGFYGSFW